MSVIRVYKGISNVWICLYHIKWQLHTHFQQLILYTHTWQGKAVKRYGFKYLVNYVRLTYNFC